MRASKLVFLLFCSLISTQQPTHSLKLRSHPSLWLPVTLEWNLEKPTMPSMFWVPPWPHFLALYTCTFRPHGRGPISQSPWHACLRFEHLSPSSHSRFYLHDTSPKKPSLTPILIKTIFPSFITLLSRALLLKFCLASCPTNHRGTQARLGWWLTIPHPTDVHRISKEVNLGYSLASMQIKK